jgi:hypothetical protein
MFVNKYVIIYIENLHHNDQLAFMFPANHYMYHDMDLG